MENERIGRFIRRKRSQKRLEGRPSGTCDAVVAVQVEPGFLSIKIGSPNRNIAAVATPVDKLHELRSGERRRRCIIAS